MDLTDLVDVLVSLLGSGWRHPRAGLKRALVLGLLAWLLWTVATFCFHRDWAVGAVGCGIVAILLGIVGAGSALGALLRILVRLPRRATAVIAMVITYWSAGPPTSE